MTSATYQREASGSAIRYVLGSADSGATMGGERAIALLQLAFFAFFGLIVAMLAAFAVSQVSGFLALVLIVLYFVACFFWFRRTMRRLEAKGTSVLGRRGRSVIGLDAAVISAEFTPASGTSSSIHLPFSDVRRAKVVNTLDKNLDVRSRDLGNLGMAVAQPTWGRTGAVLTAQAVGQARTAKAKLTCFGVALDYSNTSVMLADGLDELTAVNFYEDLTRDYAQLKQADAPVRSVG